MLPDPFCGNYLSEMTFSAATATATVDADLDGDDEHQPFA